jgi:ubiquitin C-terminal hydrolase
MINETCYHIDDDEYVPKMLYSLVSLEDYEKLSEREKTIKMKILNTINEISFVKVNILRYELLRFESKLVGFKSKKKRSSILEMFGIYKKNIYNCSRCGITLEYKVDVDVTCLEQITKSNIINRLIYGTRDFRSECPKCGKYGIKNTVILGLSNILVIMINFSGVIENNVENIKNTHELLYDEIDLTGCIERCDKDYKYKAYAIVQFPIGHFRTLAKHNGKWFVFDDDSVKELDEGKFIKEIHKYGIYMLFLERF